MIARGQRLGPPADGSPLTRCVYRLGGLGPPASSRWWVYGDFRFRSSRSLLPTSLRLFSLGQLRNSPFCSDS